MCKKCNNTDNAVDIFDLLNKKVKVIENWPIENEALLKELEDLLSKE